MRIDHLVWYAADLADGEAYFASRMDRLPVYGGVHPGEGTRNSLLALGEATYLEILARDPAQESVHCLEAELASLRGQGLYHWAAGGVDLALIRERARAIPIATSDFVTGGRNRPDGSWLGWNLLGLQGHDFGALLPFFIDWSGAAHPAAAAPRGGSLVRIETISPRAGELREIYRALGLDLVVTEGPRPAISATLQSVRGPVQIESIDPLPRGFVI
jgi:hypothetical protein